MILGINADRVICSISAMRCQTRLAENREDEIRAVALGDSHTGLGFRSSDASVVSLGFSGESVDETAIKVSWLRARLTQLRTIYLQAQPHMLGNQRDREIALPYQRLGSYTPRLAQLDPCCRAEYLVRWFELVFGFTPQSREPRVEPNGYLIYERKNPYAEKITVRADEIRALGEIIRSPKLENSFSSLVENISRRGLTVILVRYPLSREYLNAMHPDYLRATNQFFERLEREKRLPRCGFWETGSTFEETGAFVDPGHLSPEGADRYWNILRPCLFPAKKAGSGVP